MRFWFKTARDPAIVRCSMKYAFIVGPVLVAINYGDAIVQGTVDGVGLFKIGLTMMVPYLVSTFSSVGTICKMRKADETLSESDSLR
ncbi:MAG: hypothetical protein BMS9Abin18_0069 [Zetaproteobacteria bacterium]|nr:MAG: hypothetical protein BMS9Abin18_0069 [Zetaproteobacteria bacterium]